ncbi:hypothetical protein OAN61_00190 [bacterium]|nr:hypothetical protein [bacterium]
MPASSIQTKTPAKPKKKAAPKKVAGKYTAAPERKAARSDGTAAATATTGTRKGAASQRVETPASPGGYEDPTSAPAPARVMSTSGAVVTVSNEHKPSKLFHALSHPAAPVDKALALAESPSALSRVVCAARQTRPSACNDAQRNPAPSCQRNTSPMRLLEYLLGAQEATTRQTSRVTAFAFDTPSPDAAVRFAKGQKRPIQKGHDKEGAAAAALRGCVVRQPAARGDVACVHVKCE